MDEIHLYVHKLEFNKKTEDYICPEVLQFIVSFWIYLKDIRNAIENIPNPTVLDMDVRSVPDSE